MPIPRWVCPHCRANIMLESAACFRCGAAPLKPEPPRPSLAKRPFDFLAFVSIALGVVSLIAPYGCLFGLGGIAAGTASFRRTSAKAPFQGQGLAISGAVLSSVSLYPVAFAAMNFLMSSTDLIFAALKQPR